MGCCLSQPEEDAPEQERTRSPLNPDPIVRGSFASAGQIKAGVPESGQSLKLRGIFQKYQGNEHFKRKEFALAIQAYSQAIALPNPNVAYYSNLALAYKANGQYQQSIRTVNEMVRKSTFQSYEHADFFRKAQIIKSRCIIILVKEYCLSGNYNERATQEKMNMITSAVNLLEEVTSVPNTNQEVQSYLHSGLKIKHFLEGEVAPRSKKQGILQYLQERLEKVQLEGPILEFYSSPKQIQTEMSHLIQQQMKLALQQPQDHIIDPITYDIFQNPVIVPSGQTYDQQVLMQHFKNNGYNDPITHQLFKLGEKVVIRNIALHNYILQIRKPVTRADLDFLKY